MNRREFKWLLPQDAVTDVMLHGRILTTINRMPAPERVIFKRCWFDRISVRTAAREFGMPRLTARIYLLYGVTDVLRVIMLSTLRQRHRAVLQPLRPLLEAVSREETRAAEARVSGEQKASMLRAIQQKVLLTRTYSGPAP